MTEHAPDTNGTSDYERVGGNAAVSAVVTRFYELVIGDPQLAPFFESVDMARLKRHQVLLISQVLGGPAEYDGRELREAHAGMRITHTHFEAVAKHLVAALEEAGVEQDVIERVGVAIGATQEDIVTDPTG
jgi:hemoglobin